MILSQALGSILVRLSSQPANAWSATNRSTPDDLDSESRLWLQRVYFVYPDDQFTQALLPRLPRLISEELLAFKELLIEPFFQLGEE